MITSITLSNFRGIQSLELAPIRPITLIAGRNNTGKTSTLEALNIACLPPGADFGRLSRSFRNPSNRQPNTPNDFTSYWGWIFPGNHLDRVAQIDISQDGKRSAQVELRASGNGRQVSEVKIFHRSSRVSPEEVFGDDPSGIPFFTINHSGVKTKEISNEEWLMPRVGIVGTSNDTTSIAELYNTVVSKRGGEEKLEGLLRFIEPRLKKLRYLKLTDTFDSQLYCDLGGEEMIPSSLLGEGFSRVLEIMCRVEVLKSDTLLIDEIENGIHYSALPDFWRGMFVMAEKAGVQVIATTHSWECIRAALKASDKLIDKEYFQFLRLDRVDGEVQCTAPDRKALEAAEEQGWEMR